MKANCDLTPDEVKRMRLNEFDDRFGWTPESALQKWGWAMMGKKMGTDIEQMYLLGILPLPDLSDVCMTD